MEKNTYKKLLHAAGLKATPARLSVLMRLEKNTKPVSVDILKTQLRMRAPNTVTLYRMMQDFLSKGLVRRVDFGQGVALYESAKHAHHHHIICQRCGFIEDIDGCAVGALIQKMSAHSTAFATVTDHSFELFGMCTGCAKKSR